MNEENLYYLMHEDDIVAGVSLDLISGSFLKISKKARKDLLPPGGNLSEMDLKKWWKRRAVPLKQGNMERILRKFTIPSTQNYLVRNLGLSLTDHYWVKPIKQDFQWKDINLFTNDFKDEIGELQFSNVENSVLDLTNKTIFYPSASLQGELQKKWVIQDGIRYLIKGNYGNSYQQSINEVIASLVHFKQNKMPYTEYQLCQIDTTFGKGIGCICQDFANEDIEFISAYELANSVKKKNDKSEYEHFIYICSQNGLDAEMVRNFLEYQILTDFVLTNTDRHFNNFGILRNSKTLKFIDMAPIFDSGNSMFWNMPTLSATNNLLNISINSFRKKETDLLKYVKNVHQIDIHNLPSEKEISLLLEKDITSESKIKSILLGYKKKISLLDKLQHGEKIYEYGYKL